jgi:2-phospho-L-lactate guanylyltransferase
VFTVIMPIKPWDGAKSRLHPEAGVRIALARAFAQDALDAVLGCAEVGRVAVVTNGNEVSEHARSVGAVVVRESSVSGADPLGTAVELGAAWAQEHHPDDAVAVIPADLPSMTSSDLGQLLTDALMHPLAFVADANGDGTTILSAQRPELLRAGYGPGSAERHRSFGAVELHAPAGLRRDVDEFHELIEAQDLGVGVQTSAALQRLNARASA